MKEKREEVKNKEENIYEVLLKYEEMK